ncbi:hypothetical protein DFH08DRAFT_719423 [Mycena albidolilacea]|uniref:CxC2-like cysteine cluster KDZ transposase-associated domain-containing protein n=1 Tax=Mycena albidolilacea TaxID=1033008 RepID=A0AAD6Z690_9AGAR|nr:hypothetical protein DFH08DRAFT_719423 [Mycena albidolilacea]
MLHDIFLAQLLRRDGRGDAGDKCCPGCANPTNHPIYRCQECARGVLLCQRCCVQKHADNPLHVIFCAWQKWNGVYFERASLAELDLRIQFGHPPHKRCLNPEPGHQGFVVIHDNGIHNVKVNFCACTDSGREEHYIQLLRAHLLVPDNRSN